MAFGDTGSESNGYQWVPDPNKGYRIKMTGGTKGYQTPKKIPDQNDRGDKGYQTPARGYRIKMTGATRGYQTPTRGTGSK